MKFFKSSYIVLVFLLCFSGVASQATADDDGSSRQPAGAEVVYGDVSCGFDITGEFGGNISMNIEGSGLIGLFEPSFGLSSNSQGCAEPITKLAELAQRLGCTVGAVRDNSFKFVCDGTRAKMVKAVSNINRLALQIEAESFGQNNN